MQIAVRMSLLIQANEVAGTEHLLDERIVLGLGARAPVNLVRLGQLGDFLNPRFQGRVRRAHLNPLLLVVADALGQGHAACMSSFRRFGASGRRSIPARYGGTALRCNELVTSICLGRHPSPNCRQRLVEPYVSSIT
jgi:hypothetical protein